MAKKTTSSSSGGPETAMLWFFVLTTIYFAVKYITLDVSSAAPVAGSTSLIYMGIYFILLVLGEFFINLNLTDTMCGTKQWGTAMLVTLVPWVFIFGVLNLLLSVFPGWLGPFSNTFGYGIARIAGISDLFNNIFKEQITGTEGGEKGTTKGMAEALQHIYSDKSLLLNEITLVDFDRFWMNMEDLIKPEVFKTDSSGFKGQLKKMVFLKDTVAEYIWFMLTGSLVTSVGYNYVVNSGCQKSVQQMKKLEKQYEEDNKKIEEEKANAPAPRIYSSNE